MTKPMTEQSPSTKLLTLINVNQARPSKRQRTSARDWYTLAKKVSTPDKRNNNRIQSTNKSMIEEDEDEDEDANDFKEGNNFQPEDQDLYGRHWNHNSPCLGDRTLEELGQVEWKRSFLKMTGLGNLSQLSVGEESEEITELDLTKLYNTRLMAKLQAVMILTSEKGSITAVQEALLKLLASYRDVLYPKINATHHHEVRASLALHAMNHVLKTRSRVLKNNDYLARAGGTVDTKSLASPRNTQDQGFTRPKVLILLPFRNSALEWINLLSSVSSTDTVENKTRFDSEFSLPEGVLDKLAESPENYPKDHVETFSGNIDDNFRLGLKVTRKTIKLFSEFYSCDVIVASPLGLRQSIEKEKDSDFLSSIEILIVDQADVMFMQNWDHVQFILDRLNKLPEEAHGCDFSRVKPWYLDGKASFLRQSVILSTYETPELRALYSKSLTNMSGKVKAEGFQDGIMTQVPKGIKQVFTRFETLDLYSEDDARFAHFTTKTLPMLLKSAVSSSQTIIFVPSYFDFVRLKRYMKKLDDISFTSISEYTSTPDVSRARGAFYSGKKSLLLITERFHFFRRYRIRGAKTFVFYAPPDHAHFYAELMNSATHAIVSEESQIDVTDLTSQVLFSKFDLLRLERLCGTEDAKKMISGGADATRYTFLE